MQMSSFVGPVANTTFYGEGCMLEKVFLPLLFFQTKHITPNSKLCISLNFFPLVFLSAIDGNCRVTQGASVRVGTPTYSGRAETTYSCVANDNCNYDVHVIANYESNGHHDFRVHNTGNTSVNLVVNGTSTKPLILVFVSYEPVRWTLNIPSGVVIDRVILVWK